VAHMVLGELIDQQPYRRQTPSCSKNPARRLNKYTDGQKQVQTL
jgi:hypothetical protein